MIDLYDSDIIAIDEGPYAWMRQHQGSAMNVDAFVRGAEEQFAEIGFDAKVKCYTTTESGTYAFDVEINGRIDKAHQFDYDRMVHEVTHNILEDPDAETGFIKADAAADRKAAGKHVHKGCG
jgi:hypothetical protein